MEERRCSPAVFGRLSRSVTGNHRVAPKLRSKAESVAKDFGVLLEYLGREVSNNVNGLAKAGVLDEVLYSLECVWVQIEQADKDLESIY